MPARSTMLHVRMDEEVKKQAETALKGMGLSVSDAVRLFLHRVVADQAIPFEVKVPNAATRAAMVEARGMSRARFAAGDELLRSLASEED